MSDGRAARDIGATMNTTTTVQPGVALYAQYFGLHREPFSIAPDPRYLYMSERHREALAHLLYGVQGGGGFVLLTGEIGAGKTTVCRCFLEQVPGNVNIAYILNPRQSVEELLESICEEFRIPTARLRGSGGVKPLVDALNQFLLQTHAMGQYSVLIIDEAQNLAPDVLEQLRLLTNLETAERKLLQIMLIGQPELRDMLERPELEQLAQRVIARYHLRALTEEDTKRYIRHRLEVAGLTRELPVTAEALALIHRTSRGVPRRINLLCDRALLGAYAKNHAAVDVEIVERAAREVFGQVAPNVLERRMREERRRRMLMIGSGILLGLAIAALSAWQLHRVDGGDATTPQTRPTGSLVTPRTVH